MSAAPPRPVRAAFFGHGSPLNTIATNVFSDAWRAYGVRFPRPRAIVVISAHWYVPGTRISSAARPATIHDFNARFPRELFEFTYPAPGDLELVEQIAGLLAPVEVLRDATDWGFDHGAYSVLTHLFPAADIPVVQIGIDRLAPPQHHYALGQRLAPLRDDGVFIMASGNIVHNLELADPRPDEPPYSWAERFDERVWAALVAGDHAALIAYHRLSVDARLAVPTPEHYLPLLYALALQRTGEAITPIVDGFDFRAGSMRALSIGE